MRDIRNMTPEEAADRLDALVELLRDSVASAASVGFLDTLTPAENRAYWRDTIGEMGRGKRLLLVADDPDGSVAGAVQLSLTLKANGRHRASVPWPSPSRFPPEKHSCSMRGLTRKPVLSI